MKKTTATCTWALAALVGTAALLATTGTSYADRGWDNDRGRDNDRGARITRQDHRQFDRPAIQRAQPWDRHDRDSYFRRPPITRVYTYYPAPAYVIQRPAVVVPSTPCQGLVLIFRFGW